MKHVALRLYADVIQAEFGTAVEHLREPVKSTAASQALELLLQDKIVPLAVKAGSHRTVVYKGCCSVFSAPSLGIVEWLANLRPRTKAVLIMDS